MYFQTLDDKTECVGIYADEQLYFNLDSLPSALARTWSYSPYLRNHDVEYASLYLEGQKIEDIIPEYLKDDWSDISQRVLSFKRSLNIGHVSLSENCFFDLVPKRFLIEWCEVKNKITEYVFANVKKPLRYGFHHHVNMMLEDMSHRMINVCPETLRTYESDTKLAKQVATILGRPPFVKYSQFRTRTGRLTTRKDSFPILTLPKTLRSAVKPSNDSFVEIDFNGAEVRTLLGLLGKPQPPGDIHEFHLNNIFESIATRGDAKVAFFAWLYGSSQGDPAERLRLTEFYNKQELLDTYWQDGTITTPYGKSMDNVDQHHALNYLIQSTSAELTLKQALKIDYLLRSQGTGSYITFIIHDSVIVDLKDEDEWLLPSILKLMSSTNFGPFEINASQGENLANLRKLKHG